MNPLRQQAFKLRLQGYSYNEINKELGIPKGTLSSWFSGMVLSEKAYARLRSRMKIGSEVLIKRNKMQTHLARQRATHIKYEASGDIGHLSKRDLLIVGTALYWAEGYKRLSVRNGRVITSHLVSFTNSDKDMVRIFIDFLTHVLNVRPEEIRATMRLYNHINEQEALKHWTNASGIPKHQFRKTTYLVSIASQRKRPFNRLTYGTLNIEVAQTKKFYRIMGWIDGMKKGS